MTPAQLAALAELELMQRAIEDEKRRRRPARITEELERLPRESVEARKLRDELRNWLRELDQNG